MTFPQGGFDFGDIFSDAAKNQAAGRLTPKKEEKGVPWEAKIIDGKYYIPLSQVADLLRENDVLPKVRAGIEKRVDKGPPETAKQFGNMTTGKDA